MPSNYPFDIVVIERPLVVDITYCMLFNTVMPSVVLLAADLWAGEMEEAYRELYQEFIRLRSLCLRQAAMLHQLTTALQKQQGPHETHL